MAVYVLSCIVGLLVLANVALSVALIRDPGMSVVGKVVWGAFLWLVPVLGTLFTGVFLWELGNPKPTIRGKDIADTQGSDGSTAKLGAYIDDTGGHD